MPPQMMSYHIAFGDSFTGPLGACARVIARDEEQYLNAFPKHGRDQDEATEENVEVEPTGTEEQIAERIIEFRSAGVEIFLMRMSPMMEEMERFAEEVIPLVDSGLGNPDRKS